MGTLTPWRNDTDLGISHIWHPEEPSMMDSASINAHELADGRRDMRFGKRVSGSACQIRANSGVRNFGRAVRELHRTESQDRSYLDPSVDFAEA
jgi:hypothetical protein